MTTISTDVAIPAILNTLAIKIQKGLDLEKCVDAAKDDIFSFWQRDMDELTKDLTELARCNKNSASVVVESVFRTDGRNQQELLWSGKVIRDLQNENRELEPVGSAEIKVTGDNVLLLVYAIEKFPFGKIDEEALVRCAREIAGGVLVERYKSDASAALNLDLDPLPALQKRHPWTKWYWFTEGMLSHEANAIGETRVFLEQY